MTTMGDSGERRADALRSGDSVVLKGRTWTVDKAKVTKHGEVKLRLSLGAERFEGVVPKGKTFTLLRPTDGTANAIKTAAKAALATSTGAQQRWASEREHRELTRQPVAYDDGATPELDPWVPSTDAERAVTELMGGSLIGAQREPDTGLWFVPAVDGSTVMAHLLTFHATQPPSASTEDVRTPMAEQLDTAAEALMRADIGSALLLHAQQHTDGLPEGATPHRHERGSV